MSERWRDHYDRWKLDAPDNGDDVQLDEDGEPIDQDRLDAEAEAAAEARAERLREEMMFDRDEREE